MIDFPIDELLDEDVCHKYLLNRLHPEGLKCPHCGCEDRYTVKKNTWFDGYQYAVCKKYYTMYSGTVFEKARQSASKIVLLLRGFAKGESTARLNRELKIDRKPCSIYATAFRTTCLCICQALGKKAGLSV